MDNTRKPFVTFESVATAAESLTTAGQRPSVRAVIAALGGGSPNAVLPQLQAWKAARPSVKAADITLDPRIAAILAEQIITAVIDATRAAEARAADLEADAEAVAESGRLAEACVEKLSTELAHFQTDNQQQAGRLDALTHEIDQAKKEAATAIAEARADAQREREAAEQARKTLARAELRLESMPALEGQLGELHAQIDTERTGRTAAEKTAAVAQAEKMAAERRAHDLREELRRAREEASNWRGQINALQSQTGARPEWESKPKARTARSGRPTKNVHDLSRRR